MQWSGDFLNKQYNVKPIPIVTTFISSATYGMVPDEITSSPVYGELVIYN